MHGQRRCRMNGIEPTLFTVDVGIAGVLTLAYANWWTYLPNQPPCGLIRRSVSNRGSTSNLVAIIAVAVAYNTNLQLKVAVIYILLHVGIHPCSSNAMPSICNRELPEPRSLPLRLQEGLAYLQ